MKNKTITIPKLKDMKIKGYRKTKEIKGRIINATISKEINRYYVSVLYEEDLEEKNIIPKTIVGIDLGVKDLLITSFGEKYENKKYITKYEKRIKNLNKRNWTCFNCKNENDRDINAAINITWEGLINNTKLFT